MHYLQFVKKKGVFVQDMGPYTKRRINKRKINQKKES